jgi:hypothetical protein
VLGEFGVPNANGAKPAYLAFVYDLLDELRGHGIMWEGAASPTLWNGEDFSVLQGDRTEQPWADVIVRPYPRAISGTIMRFSWDSEGLRFELVVSNAGSGVSEVYLPTRHLGAAPQITIGSPATGLGTTARVRFVPERDLLLIQADVPGGNYAVTVTP